MHIEGRATRITLIDGRVDLNEIVVRATSDVTAAGRNDTGRYRAAQAKRVADRKYPIANSGLAIRKLHKWKVRAALDLDQSNIGPRVCPDYFRGVGLSGVRRYFDLVGAINDVVVGNGISIG